MREDKPPVTLDLTWQGELKFAVVCDGHRVLLDSAGAAGPSPAQALAFSLAACMAMDVVHILTKGRSTIQAMTVRLSGQRADDHPRRFVSFEAHFSLAGDLAREKVERAIVLSREKYCSVWHSMREDIVFSTSFDITPSS